MAIEDNFSKEELYEMLCKIGYLNLEIIHELLACEKRNRFKEMEDFLAEDVLFISKLPDNLLLSLEDFIFKVLPKIEAENLKCSEKELPLKTKQMFGYFKNRINKIKKEREDELNKTTN